MGVLLDVSMWRQGVKRTRRQMVNARGSWVEEAERKEERSEDGDWEQVRTRGGKEEGKEREEERRD